ncbi:MAG: hypothetical protein KDA74_22525, partial [Planctomycetaceae bacterium]|nr:hypothetical protein [Planctomycetaceae bacterium]
MKDQTCALRISETGKRDAGGFDWLTSVAKTNGMLHDEGTAIGLRARVRVPAQCISVDLSESRTVEVVVGIPLVLDNYEAF